MLRLSVFPLLIAVFLLSSAVQAQPSDGKAITVKTNDGIVTITPMNLRLRGYNFVPVEWDEGVIRLEDEQTGATAILDLGKSSCFCLTVSEGSLEMRINCDWSNICIPDHVDIWSNLTDNDRSFFSRTAIQRSLIAGIPDRY